MNCRHQASPYPPNIAQFLYHPTTGLACTTPCPHPLQYYSLCLSFPSVSITVMQGSGNLTHHQGPFHSFTFFGVSRSGNQQETVYTSLQVSICLPLRDSSVSSLSCQDPLQVAVSISPNRQSVWNRVKQESQIKKHAALRYCLLQRPSCFAKQPEATAAQALPTTCA